MILKSGNTEAVVLDYNVFKALLNIYPEEKLYEHEIFRSAIEKKSITFNALKDISEKIHIPWQMFLLDSNNLKRELSNIEKNRLDKFPNDLLVIHKRKGMGEITSKRIIDRLIRMQSFVSAQLPANQTCGFIGVLKNKTTNESAAFLVEHFQIDLEILRKQDTAEKSKNYLISKIQSKGNINISQGVRTNNILPQIDNTYELYKNTSGFVVKDSKIPFVFLPSEVNPNENHYRQIYTLLYLVVVIGMEQYSHSIESYSFKKIKDDKKFKQMNEIVSEILLPKTITDPLKEEEINKELVNKLKEKYRLSYSAVLFILRMRKKIDKDKYKTLELPRRPMGGTGLNKIFFHQKISTSVGKFCGKIAYGIVNKAIKSSQILPNQAQMIIFGRIRRDKWADYNAEI